MFMINQELKFTYAACRQNICEELFAMFVMNIFPIIIVNFFLKLVPFRKQKIAFLWIHNIEINVDLKRNISIHIQINSSWLLTNSEALASDNFVHSRRNVWLLKFFISLCRMLKDLFHFSQIDPQSLHSLSKEAFNEFSTDSSISGTSLLQKLGDV